MVPNEENSFTHAEHLWAAGDVDAAVQLYVDLSRHARAPDLRLRSALAIVERVNPSRNAEIILEACSTGIELAEILGEPQTKAYVMGMRAKNLGIVNGFLSLARKNLRLAPVWLGFSLERDENQCKSLTAQIHANDDEIGHLVRSAQQESTDQTTLGHVLLSVGNVWFQRYLTSKADFHRKSIPLPSFVRKELRNHMLDDYLLYNATDCQALHKQLRECEMRYLEAAASFRAAGDELNEGYAIYALANDLRSANRFRKAKRYLIRAEMIANRHKDQKLLQSIAVVKERIRRRNRNVPNYVAGEQ